MMGPTMIMMDATPAASAAAGDFTGMGVGTPDGAADGAGVGRGVGDRLRRGRVGGAHAAPPVWTIGFGGRFEAATPRIVPRRGAATQVCLVATP